MMILIRLDETSCSVRHTISTVAIQRVYIDTSGIRHGPAWIPIRCFYSAFDSRIGPVDQQIDPVRLVCCQVSLLETDLEWLNKPAEFD